MTRRELRSRRREFMKLVRDHRRDGCELSAALQCARDDMESRYGNSADWPSIIQMITEIVFKFVENCDPEDLDALAKADMAIARPSIADHA